MEKEFIKLLNDAWNAYQESRNDNTAWNDVSEYRKAYNDIKIHAENVGYIVKRNNLTGEHKLF